MSTITEDAIAAHATTQATHAAAATEPATVAPSDYESLNEELRAENKRLTDVLAASRISSTPTASNRQSTKPAVTSERVRTLLGPVAILHMTRSEKLQSLGIDPASVTDEYLRRLFGRGNDGTAATELTKTNQSRYFLLREAAKILNIFCN